MACYFRDGCGLVSSPSNFPPCVLHLRFNLHMLQSTRNETIADKLITLAAPRKKSATVRSMDAAQSGIRIVIGSNLVLFSTIRQLPS